MKKHLFTIVYCTLLILFSGYVFADTFVIKDVKDPTSQDLALLESRIEKDGQLKADNAATSEKGNILLSDAQSENDDNNKDQNEDPLTTPIVLTSTPAPVLPTWSKDGYVDENIDVKIAKHREFDSDIYVVDIKLKDPLLMKTGIAKHFVNAEGKTSNWQFTSDIAGSYDDLIVAINGDCWVSRNGYSIKNGVLLRDSITTVSKGFQVKAPDQEDVVFYRDGSVDVIREGSVSADELIEKGAYNLYNFGPTLIEAGVNVSETSVSTSDVAGSRNPRTAIGYYEKGHYCFIVVDGRNGENAEGLTNRGVTCKQLAEFGMSLGIYTLYNLDGGGSATLYFNGKVLNNPCRHNKIIEESTVSDIVYIGY